MVQFSHSVMSGSLQPHESQHAGPPCPSPTPGSGGRIEPEKTVPGKTEPGKTEKDDAAEPGRDSKLLLNYLLLLDSLPDTVNDESDRAGAMRLLNELLADKDFTDDGPRKNCIDIRRFLVSSQQPLLPYLAADKNVHQHVVPKIYRSTGSHSERQGQLQQKQFRKHVNNTLLTLT